MGSQAPLGKKDLFNTPGAELPGYVREIARELIKQGKTKSQAIQIAIGMIKRWAAGGGGVKPDTVAKAQRALAQWEAAKAKAHATPDKGRADLSNPAGLRGMIALEVPAGSLPTIDGGEAEEDLHLTLSYLGDDVSDREFAGAISRALGAAQESQPITATVGGLGVFPAKDGKQAVWATVDAPEISRLHGYVLGGRRSGEAHGFTPHITMKWIKEGGRLPAPLPKTMVTFTHLIVKRGDQTLRFPLGGDYREWSNPLAVSGRQVLLATAPEPAAKKEKEKKSADKSKLPPGATGWKHGWIPVDDSGKAVGPAQKPKWFRDAEAKHKAAGGRTAEEIDREKAANEFKRKADKAAAPGKKAKAEAERKTKQAEAEKKRKTAEAERKKKAAERDKEKKAREKERLIQSAYRQALSDRKNGRELSEQQRRVVAFVEARQKKEQGRLRRVDVPGADGSKVSATAPKKTAKKTTKKTVKPPERSDRRARVINPAGQARRAAGGAVTRRTGSKASTVVRAKSYTSGWQQNNRSRRQGGTVRLANPYAPWDEGGGVNVVDLAGRANPLGQLAFRYKHGWILINPGIPSRGHLGGGLARKHGVKSGTTTKGHFADAGNGKKKFVPESTGHKGPGALAQEMKLKAGANQKSKYGLTAAQKDDGSSVLKPSIPSAEKVNEVSKAANDASMKANASKSLADAQVAAKKHADAFVQAKKAGQADKAEAHKANAQAWAKKAQQIKQAEKASADAKKKHEEEQKAKAAEAEAAEKQKKKEAMVKGAKTIQDAYALLQIADKMPENNTQAMKAKAQQYMHAHNKYGEAIKLYEENGLYVPNTLSVQKKAAGDKAVDLAQKSVEYKKKAVQANELGSAAFLAGEKADQGTSFTAHQVAAKKHADAAKLFEEIGQDGDAKMHAEQLVKHTMKAKEIKEQKASAPKAESKPDVPPNIAKSTANADKADAISSVIDDLPEHVGGSLAKWEDYLHAAHAAKSNSTPENLKKLKGATDSLMSDGVELSDIKDATSDLFKKAGFTKAVKKTVAQKKAAQKKAASPTPDKAPPTDAEKKDAAIGSYQQLIENGNFDAAEKVKAYAIAQGFASESDFPAQKAVDPKDWEVTLPGPGMYKDGNTIMKLMNKPTTSPEEDAAKKAATDKALADFEQKHGKKFDPNSVEIDYSMSQSSVPQLSSDFFKDAQDAGYTHPDPSVDVTNGWKPPNHTKASIMSYTGSGYTAINGQLRGLSPMSDSVRNHQKRIDEAFAAAPGLDKDTVVIRKMTTSGQFPTYPPPMDEGDEYVDYGYGSTSKSTSGWSGKIVMEVRLPEGLKVIDVNHNGVVSASTSEQEIMLPRGARYRVVKDEMINGQRRITTEVVGVGETHPNVKL